MEKKIFGTDGIRGLAYKYPINEEFMNELVMALTIFFELQTKKVLIGKDTRESGEMIESALSLSFQKRGFDCYILGVIPTAVIPFVIKDVKADIGIMISASHNPYHDNGIKIFKRNGEKLSDSEEFEIEKIILNKKQQTIVNKSKGRKIDFTDKIELYKENIKKIIPHGLSFHDLKIVVDCANGSASKIAPEILSELGINLIIKSKNPNGVNINKNCGALFPKKISEMVIKNKANLGISFDGDADRLTLVDNKGKILDGDKILAIAGKSMKKQNKLSNLGIVSTVMANIGLKEYLNKNSLKLFQCPVGDRYVVSEMKKRAINLGGEQSGHFIFSDFSFTGDAIISALQIFIILKMEDKSIDQLLKDYVSYPQKLVNFKLKKSPIEILKNKELQKIIEHEQKNSKDNLMILLRKSGTENLLRLMVQSRSLKSTNLFINYLSSEIKEIDNK